MPHLKSIHFLLAALLLCLIPSCADDTSVDYHDKLEKRNEKYLNYNERRRMRIQARQERTDAWFKRVMGT